MEKSLKESLQNIRPDEFINSRFKNVYRGDLSTDESLNSNLDIDTNLLNNQQKLLEISRYQEDTKSRKNLAFWSVIVVSFWLIAVLLILTVNHIFMKLSDNVLIALLGTTTLNVLGLSYIVLKAYFKY